MTYKEFLNNRTYPIVTYCAVKSNSIKLADCNDRKEEELGDMNVLAIIHQVVYSKEHDTMIPTEVVVLGESLENTDEEVSRYFKDLK
jgi:hypothetical protein